MTAFDATRLHWLVSDGDGSTSYRIYQETSILGYYRDAGTLDMLVRFDDWGGHCPAHRHVTATRVLVPKVNSISTTCFPEANASTRSVRRVSATSPPVTCGPTWNVADRMAR